MQLEQILDLRIAVDLPNEADHRAPADLQEEADHRAEPSLRLCCAVPEIRRFGPVGKPVFLC